MGQRSVGVATSLEGGEARVGGAAVSRAGNGDLPVIEEKEVRSVTQGTNGEGGQGGQDASERGSMGSFGLLDLDRLFPRHDNLL